MRHEGSWLRVAQAEGSIVHWQLSPLVEAAYISPAASLTGGMDAAFFKTRERNVIPHDYPCRTHFADRFRDRPPEPNPPAGWTEWRFPHSGIRIERSGFWYRPTRLSSWARTWIATEDRRTIVVRLATFGGAAIHCDGTMIGWLTPYRRNDEQAREFTLDLAPGLHEIGVWFDDLAERDTRYAVSLSLVAGGPVTVALPLPIKPEIASALSRLLAGIRFETPTIEGGAVRAVLPGPAPVDLAVTAEAHGDGICGGHAVVRTSVAAGATAIDLGPADHLPAGYLSVRITLSAAGFSLDRVLPVEILHGDWRMAPCADPVHRADRVLERLARGPDTLSTAQAMLMRGRADRAALRRVLETALVPVEQRYDCADFLLTALLWIRMEHPADVPEELTDRIDTAIRGFRYWLDEPGDDVMWFFSENHALLFHVCQYLAGIVFPGDRFPASGRTGRDQTAIAEDRLHAWFDAFEAHELAEWNSAPYFPIDLLGLTALMRLGPDAALARRAERAAHRLIEIVARTSHHGFLTASQGRSYEHSLRPARSLEISGIAWLLWGVGAMPSHGFALGPLAALIRDGRLTPDPSLAEAASCPTGVAVDWRYVQGPGRLAALQHFKTHAYALGTAAGYRPGGWGYQETLLHARVGRDPDTQIWINHPGEPIIGGFARPSYWGGSAALPRVHQYRGLAVLLVEPHPGTAGFSHAWFPWHRFDALAVERHMLAFAAGDAFGVLRSLNPLEPVTTGPTAGVEVRQSGDRHLWILRLAVRGDFGSFDRFQAAMRTLTADLPDDAGRMRLADPEYGPLTGHADGRLTTPHEVIDPATWTIAGTVVTHDLAEAAA
ncbi:MAG: hypothetical protein ACTS3R_05935 [Inquilinaceae bacterium]